MVNTNNINNQNNTNTLSYPMTPHNNSALPGKK